MISFFLWALKKIHNYLVFLRRSYCQLFLCAALISEFSSASALDYLNYEELPSRNIWGEIGLIVIPSAQSSNEGTIAVNYSSNEIFDFGSIYVHPFDWLEAGYFYYRPSDLWWTGPNDKGKYLDKGFSVKFKRNISDNFSLAIGLSDFAGTGFFTREYLVSTYSTRWVKFTSGIGWGKFNNQAGNKNPLRFFDSGFSNRPKSSGPKTGGSLSYDQWFRGNISYLGGLEISVPDFYKLPDFIEDSVIKIEYDPFDYVNNFSVGPSFRGESFDLRKKDSNLNFGISIPIFNNFNVGVSYIKGNTFNVSFNISGNFSKPFFKKRTAEASIKNANKGSTNREKFHENLILNINRNNIFLQTSQITENKLEVAVASPTYRDPVLMHSIVGEIAYKIHQEIPLDLETVKTINTNVGYELGSIETPINLFKNKRDAAVELVQRESTIDSGNKDGYQTYSFRPVINFPASFTSLTPALVNHIGDPQKFYFGGLILRLDNEIQFSRSLQLKTEIHHSLLNNFDEKRNFPDSKLPTVRTDIVSYLQGPDTYLSRMQLDYFFMPKHEIYGKLSAGILENMYAGGGLELLYKPFKRNFSISLDAYTVKKRDFDRRFDLLEYSAETGHLSFNYHLPDLGILGTISFGKYLAGDKGYTFDISRRLNSGFRAGIFFTRTNVSAELFGEGSFDKGFYFQIPIDLFLNSYR